MEGEACVGPESVTIGEGVAAVAGAAALVAEVGGELVGCEAVGVEEAVGEWDRKSNASSGLAPPPLTFDVEAAAASSINHSGKAMKLCVQDFSHKHEHEHLHHAYTRIVRT